MPSLLRQIPRLGTEAGVSWLRVALITGLAAYTIVLSLHVSAYAGGADSSGYVHSARLLAAGRLSTPMRALSGLPPDTMPPAVYMPLGFRTFGSASLVPIYPMGLPLMIAAVARVTGWESASHVTMVLHALAGVLLVFWLARACGLSPHASAIAGLLLATSPLALFVSLMLMSDMPALVWTTVAVLLAWRSRGDSRWALAAGAAVALAVLIRPTNILILVPVAVCLGLSPERWLWLVAGGAPGALLLIRYNLAAYGAAITTGYGDFSSSFRLANVEPSLRNYLSWLLVLLTPLGVFALGLPAILRRAPQLITVLLLWIAVFFVFYAFYFHTHETWWYLRFVLPAFPPIIVGSLWVGRLALERWYASLTARVPAPCGRRVTARGWPAAVLAAAIVAHNMWWGNRLNVLETGLGEQVYVDAAEWTQANLPPDAAILAAQVSGSFLYYTDFPVLRWDFLSGEPWRRIKDAVLARRQPLYAVLFPYEIEELNAFRDRIPGTWVQIGAIEHVTVWQFTGASQLR